MTDRHDDSAADDDATRLAPRAEPPAYDEDATQLSPRERTGVDDESDATQLSPRSSEPQHDADDATRIAGSRTANPDATQLSPQRHGAEVTGGTGGTGGTSSEATRVANVVKRTRDRSRPPLPPGRVVGPTTHAGSFGETEGAYGPRRLPPQRVSQHEPDAPAPELRDVQQSVLTPSEAAHRRDAARRRRLTVVIVVACVVAAALTAGVIGAIALVGGGA